MPFELTSTAFSAGEPIPRRFTGEGEDLSPPLEWKNSPEGTTTYAIVVDDPDAPDRVFVHWIIYNLPGISRELAEGVPKEPSLPNGAKQGRNDFGEIGYSGPAPPPGSAHHYFFRIYALDSGVNLPPGASKEELLVSMHNHILDQAELIGTYTAGRVPLEQAR
jgi:Raf kinase inhibitor-like YbhB/YbcL family protein